MIEDPLVQDGQRFTGVLMTMERTVQDLCTGVVLMDIYHTPHPKIRTFSLECSRYRSMDRIVTSVVMFHGMTSLSWVLSEEPPHFLLIVYQGMQEMSTEKCIFLRNHALFFGYFLYPPLFGSSATFHLISFLRKLGTLF